MIRCSTVLGWVVGVVVGMMAAGSGPALGQGVTQTPAAFYGVTVRPPSVEYLVETYGSFDLIYQKGYRDAALRIGSALETSKAGTDSLIGLTPQPIRMPVVVNGYNDRGNGFVTPLPFRQEIEAISIKEPQLTGRAPSWPALVGPHELVHATHAEVNPGFGVGRVLRWVAPDWSRAVNLTAPRGLIEGIAVYRESRLHPRMGRLNAPLFRMKMRAAMLSDDPWSFTQMMEPPRYNMPLNRFYIGGAFAFEELAAAGDSTNASFFQTAVAWHHRFPFLGHGVGLWVGTGDSPNALNSRLQDTFRTRFQSEIDRLGPLTQPTRIASAVGAEHRRPVWIDDETLVAYVTGYDTRSGFYRFDAATGARTLVRVQTLTEDRVYSLTRDSTALLASRYVPDPLVGGTSIAEVERIDLATGAAKRLTDGGRALAPVEAPDGSVWTVTNDGPFTQWAVVQPDGRATPLTAHARTRFQQIAPSPGGTMTAVLLNVNGETRIYRADVDDRRVILRPWLGLQDALIYDLSWGPSGRHLFFASDRTGIANVYVLKVETGQVLQLTNVPFGAREPALSPDGQTLAYVDYRHERYDLVRIPFRPNAAAEVPAAEVLLGKDGAPPALQTQVPPPPVESPSANEEARPYQAWRYLRPRMVYPVLRGNDEDSLPTRDPTLGWGVGVSVAGSDPVERWAYQGTGYWQDGRLWGEARIERAALLRPSLRLYNEPVSVPVRVRDGEQTSVVPGVLEERGAAFGLSLPVRLRSNVFQDIVRVGLETEVRQTRLSGNAFATTPYRDRVTLSPTAVVGWRLQQNLRDFIPNTGVVLSGVAEVDAWTDGVAASRALIGQLDVYLPALRSTHTGLRLRTRLITQNRGSIFNLDSVLPRGYEEDLALGSGTFAVLGGEVVQPLLYVDDGLTLLPVYLKALGAYGFAETLTDATDPLADTVSSLGGGLEVRARLFYALDLTLRVGGAYRVDLKDGAWIFR